MPKIELELSQEVFDLWQGFLKTPAAAKLIEEKRLGDWTALAFMAQARRFLIDGLPKPTKEADPAKEKEKEAASARKRLTKMQKRILPMFNENDNQTLDEMTRLLGLTEQQGKDLLKEWLDSSFLDKGPMRNGQQSYILSTQWLDRNMTANRPSLNAPRNASLLDTYRAPK